MSESSMSEFEDIQPGVSDGEDEKSEKEREKIKEQLSKMSFEDLQKLKEEMGTKLYTKTVFGDKQRKKFKTDFKRANKNRPREMSSKKIIPINYNLMSGKKPASRDPRFEPLCGTFDKKTFKQDYKFVNDLRKKEKSQLEEELKNVTNAEERKRIKFVVQRLENQIREEEKSVEQEQEKKAVKMKLKEEKWPKKKSVAKLDSLIKKYEELKKSNKIQKHLEKKSKKITAKERKNMRKQNLLID